MNKRYFIIAVVTGFFLAWTCVFLSFSSWQHQRFTRIEKQLEQERDMVRLKLQLLKEKQESTSTAAAVTALSPGAAYSIVSGMAKTAHVELAEINAKSQSENSEEKVPPIHVNIVGNYGEILQFLELLRQQPGFSLIHGGLTANDENRDRSIRASLIFTLSPEGEVQP